jgi:RimJ/RimL family protein N-acetyltransferase
MSYQELPNQESNQCQTFELQPHLVGDLLEVRPLRPEDWESLFAVASDPLIWEQHPAHDRYKEEVFKDFFRESLESGGALVVIDRKTQKIIGSSRYFGFDDEQREIEIGWTFLARSHWGGKYNGELKRLMLDHAFKFVESVVFLVGLTNVRSRRALEKIGGVLTERRKKTNLHGKTVEHVVYQIKKPAITAPT